MRSIVLLILSGIVIAGCTNMAVSPPPEIRSGPVTIAVRTFLSDAPFIIADELGYFKDVDLDVDVVIQPKGKHVAPLLHSGEVDLAVLGDKWTVLSEQDDIEHEIDIIADLGGGGRRWKVMAKNGSGISTLQDLDGRKIGSWLTSYGYAKFEALMKKQAIGFIPVQLRGDGEEESMTTQLTMDSLSGDLDAVLVWEPQPTAIRLQGQGYEIFTFGHEGEEMAIYLHMKKGSVTADDLFKIFSAISRAQRYIAQHPEEAGAIMARLLPDDIDVVAQALGNIDFNLSIPDMGKLDALGRVFDETGINDIQEEIVFDVNEGPLRTYLQQRSTVLIGWDGVNVDRFFEMFEKGTLPHAKDMFSDSCVTTSVTTGTAQTKPGWAEILTGYGPTVTGVTSNEDYQAIPEGLTIFERIEEDLPLVETIFISGKQNNVGARGSHRICTNCLHRDRENGGVKLKYWDESSGELITENDEPPQLDDRDGEPYFHTSTNIDHFDNNIGPQSAVLAEALGLLSDIREPFFLFLHFEEPDELGHLFGENSSEYHQALKELDANLKRLQSALEETDLIHINIYLVSDHSFDEDQMYHSADMRAIFCSAQSSLRPGDRKDVAPTIYDELGVDVGSFSPPLHGRSLITK